MVVVAESPLPRVFFNRIKIPFYHVTIAVVSIRTAESYAWRRSVPEAVILRRGGISSASLIRCSLGHMSSPFRPGYFPRGNTVHLIAISHHRR